MYLPNITNSLIEEALSAYKEHVAEVMGRLKLEVSEEVYQRGTNFYDLARSEKSLYLLTSGQLQLSINDRAILVYEEGDLVGLEANCLMSTCKVESDFAVKAQPISREYFEDQIKISAETYLFSPFLSVLMNALASYMPHNSVFEPEVRRYKSGEIIVEQGSYGDDIYTLVEGHAEVFVDGRKVGEIMADEVFGSLAAMTDIGRTATIVSSANSLVLSLKKGNLIELIKLRPGTIEKLIGDLARVIQDQNKKLAVLQNS